MPAATNPLKPAGSIACTITGNAAAPSPIWLANSKFVCEYVYAIIPGTTNRNIGVNFRKPAKIVAFLAVEIFLAAKALCTIN